MLNPHDYEYILNPGFDVCGQTLNSKVTLLAMVTISASSFHNRFMIRNTWGSRSIYPDQLKIIFIIGDTFNKEFNKKIR